MYGLPLEAEADAYCFGGGELLFEVRQDRAKVWRVWCSSFVFDSNVMSLPRLLDLGDRLCGWSTTVSALSR